MTSYGVCPSCKNCYVFGIPIKFIGTASIQNGQINISDYSFQNNTVPELMMDSLICGACNAVFNATDVLSVETCTGCNNAFFSNDMLTVNNIPGTAYGSEHRMCINCAPKLQTDAADTQPAPKHQTSIPERYNFADMSKEQLLEWAMRQQAAADAAGCGTAVAPEEDITEPINYIPEAPPDFPDTDYGHPAEGVPVNIQAGTAPETTAQVGSTPGYLFQGSGGEGDYTVPGGFTDTNITADTTDRYTAAGQPAETDSGTEIYQQGAEIDASGITALPGAYIPDVIREIIDPTAFPFQPVSNVEVLPNGGVIL